MPLLSWSTRDVPQNQRFDYWQDVVCRSVLNFSLEHPHDGIFHGELTARRTPTLSYSRMQSTGYDARRDKVQAANSGEECYVVSLLLSGGVNISQGESKARFVAGELFINEGWRAFSVGYDEAVSRIVTLVPRRMLNARLPLLSTETGLLRAVSATAPFADLLREYMLRLSDPASGISDATAETLGENLCNLLATVTAGDAAGNLAASSVQSMRVEALLAYVRRNLHDPALSVAGAAAHLAISVRSVHMLLEPAGESFGALVLEQRLQACARALRNPALLDRRIASIAYGCGFSDLSHFNRGFKLRFGMTPGEARRGG